MTNLLECVRERYRDLFSISEIEQSDLLRTLYWTLLIGFILSFNVWNASDFASRESALRGLHLCPPYFPSCDRLYFFAGAPAYSQALVFAGLTGILVLSAMFAYRKFWAAAHFLLLPPTAFKLFYVFFLTHKPVIEYEYFHVPVVLMFLFPSRKLFFARRVLVLTYLFSATMKFSETWIVGGYFTALKNGMPLVPDSLVPFVTNGVTLFEIVSPWFLLSRNRNVRWGTLGLWLVFHLYSICLVGFAYPTYCVPILLALFLPDPEPDLERKTVYLRGSACGWLVLGGLTLLNMVPWFVSGDRLYSLQGRKFGAQMFDANHQCKSTETRVFKDGSVRTRVHSNAQAMRRCGPYTRYFRLKFLCHAEANEGENPLVAIRWRFDSSVNGGPFFRIVEEPDACVLSYSTLGANPWIKNPPSEAPVVGYPKKNTLLGGPTTEEVVYASEDPSMRTSSQVFFASYLKTISWVYWAFWIAGFIIHGLGLGARRDSRVEREIFAMPKDLGGNDDRQGK